MTTLINYNSKTLRKKKYGNLTFDGLLSICEGKRGVGGRGGGADPGAL